MTQISFALIALCLIIVGIKSGLYYFFESEETRYSDYRNKYDFSYRDYKRRKKRGRIASATLLVSGLSVFFAALFF